MMTWTVFYIRGLNGCKSMVIFVLHFVFCFLVSYVGGSKQFKPMMRSAKCFSFSFLFSVDGFRRMFGRCFVFALFYVNV